MGERVDCRDDNAKWVVGSTLPLPPPLPLPGVSSAQFITLLMLCAGRELPPKAPTTYCGSWLYSNIQRPVFGHKLALGIPRSFDLVSVYDRCRSRCSFFFLASFSESISRLDGGAYRFARMCISSLSTWFDPDHVHHGVRRGW